MFTRARHRADKSAKKTEKSFTRKLLDAILGQAESLFVPKNERLLMRLVKGETIAHVYPMLKANTGKRHDDLVRRGFEVITLKEAKKFPGMKEPLPAGTHVIKLVPTKRAVWIDHSKYPPDTLRKVNTLARRLERRAKQEQAHAA